MNAFSDSSSPVLAAAFARSSTRAFDDFRLLALTAIVIAALGFRRRQQFMNVQQASLQRSEDRFRTLTENSADIALITDSAGVIKYVSPSAKATLADDRSTLLGKSLADTVHPEDGRQLEQLLTSPRTRTLSWIFGCSTRTAGGWILSALSEICWNTRTSTGLY